MNPLSEPLVLLGLVGRDRIPRAVRIQLRWVIIVVAFVWLGPLGLLACALAVGATTRQWIVGNPLAMALWVLALPLFIVGLPRLVGRRFAREVRAQEYLVCMNCGHSLRGLPEEHRCPECGQPYSVGELKDQWAGWFKSVRL
jgi:hypothetical protein